MIRDFRQRQSTLFSVESPRPSNVEQDRREQGTGQERLTTVTTGCPGGPLSRPRRKVCVEIVEGKYQGETVQS